jgi:hypothetical protein
VSDVDARRFAKQLVRDLVTPHIKRRLTTPGLQNFVRNKAVCYLNIRGAALEDEPADGEDLPEDQPELVEQGANPEPGQVTEPPSPPKRTKRCFVCVSEAPSHRKGSTFGFPPSPRPRTVSL